MTESEGVSDERHRRLMQRYQEIAILAGGLAHEIKNPLSTIRLNLSLMAEDFEKAESIRDQRTLRKIRILEQESERLNDILEDFLQFARVQELRIKPCDLNEVIENLIEFLHPEAQQMGIDLVHYQGDIPPVDLDRELFKQALLNLIQNAEHALPDGGQIILQTRKVPGAVQLDVIDNGTGIDLDTQEKIFRPFFSNHKGGSGLGLPTVRKTVEAHNGTIRVESECEKGTRFIITIPTEQET